MSYSLKRIPPFRSLDAIRGFAALWVVMDHSCASWISGHQDYLHHPLYGFSIRGSFGVVLFFVISGYCITAAAYAALTSGKTVGRYVFERCRRIYPPYLAAVAVSVFLALTLHFAQTHHLLGAIHHPPTLPSTTRDWLGNLLLLQFELHVDLLVTVAWSLCYEVAFYVVVGLILIGAKRIQKKNGQAAAAVFFSGMLAASTLLTLGYLLFARQAVFPFDLWHQFSLGGLLFFALETNPERVPGWSFHRHYVRAFMFLSAGATLWFALTPNVGATDYAHPPSPDRSFACLIFCACLALLRPWDDAVSRLGALRPWMWLGGFSYSLYLSHSLIVGFVDVLLRRAGFEGDRYWIAFWPQVIVSVLFGRVFFQLFERPFLSRRMSARLASEHALSQA